jgi:hypothetical protein
MQRILSAALLLEYKRALLAAGDAIDPADYLLTSPPDTNASNIERLSKVSVAHLAGVARLNALIPHVVQERSRIQANRKRSDAEILPLLGRAYEPQFAGTLYADAARDLYATLDLYAITAQGAPERILLIGDPSDLPDLQHLAGRLKYRMLVAVAIISAGGATPTVQDGYTLHKLPASSLDVATFIDRSDAIVAAPAALALSPLASTSAPIATWGDTRSLPRATRVHGPDDPGLDAFPRSPRA